MKLLQQFGFVLITNKGYLDNRMHQKDLKFFLFENSKNAKHTNQTKSS